MQLNRSFLRCATIASGFLAVLPTAHADEIFVASSSTVIQQGNPFSGSFNVIGACGGAAQSVTLNGDVLLIGDSLGRIYKKGPADSFVGYAYDVPNDAQALAMHGGNLLTAGTDGTIARVNATTGAVLDTMTASVPLTAILVSGDDVFVGSSLGVVQKGHATNGGFQFWGTCGGPINSIARDATHLIVGSSNGVVYRLDLQTQAVATSFSVPNDALAMTVQGGDLLVGGSDGKIHRLRRTDGALKSTLETFVPVDALALQREIAPGSAYCYGNGCPCGNDDPTAGCANSTGFGGKVAGDGSASIAADDLAIYAYQIPPNKNGRFYMSQNTTHVPLGDGFLCAGGGGYPSLRFPFHNAGPAGALALPQNLVSWCSQNFGPSGQIFAGSTWHFQAWYRNAQGPCGQNFNTTNSYSVTFVP